MRILVEPKNINEKGRKWEDFEQRHDSENDNEKEKNNNTNIGLLDFSGGFGYLYFL
jgi:hypothetical protein